MKTKSALSYFGSDSEVASSLAAMLDHCSHVTIPFIGGAAILPHLKARSIVANDLNYLAINFYRVASGVHGPFAQRGLIDRCQKTLSHPSEMNDAEELLLKDKWNADHDLAWAYWAACWLGRKGKAGTKHMGGMPSVRRTANGGSNASRVRAAASDLTEWAKHFERCEWQSVSYSELLPRVADDPKCGLYCDPPWMDLGRDYAFPFSDQDHIDLCEGLSRFEKTKVVIRYGDHPLVRQYYSEAGWTILDAQSRTQSNSVKGEIWITNTRSNA